MVLMVGVCTNSWKSFGLAIDDPGFSKSLMVMRFCAKGAFIPDGKTVFRRTLFFLPTK
jgi:hypothetical protein